MFAISSFMLLEDYKQKNKPDSTLCFVIYYCREAPVIKESQKEVNLTPLSSRGVRDAGSKPSLSGSCRTCYV